MIPPYGINASIWIVVSLLFLNYESYNGVESTIRLIKLGFLMYKEYMPSGRYLSIFTTESKRWKGTFFEWPWPTFLIYFSMNATWLTLWSISIHTWLIIWVSAALKSFLSLEMKKLFRSPIRADWRQWQLTGGKPYELTVRWPWQVISYPDGDQEV